jgi:hypothetical protein
MNDQERLGVLLDKLKQLEGLDEERFRRLTAELARGRTTAGYDEQGRLQVVLFDAQSYDIASFDRCNDGRHALHYMRASLKS